MNAPADSLSLIVFRLRTWARARLWGSGELSLHEAVDVLQVVAEHEGIIQLIGQDAVQEILAQEFADAHA